MEYNIQELSNLAGISKRTIRYHDEINIFKPSRLNSSGYRIYGEKEVDRLQQKLFYKALGVKLDHIKKIISSPIFNEIIALKEHREKLLEKRIQLDLLISNVDKTIKLKEGGNEMSNNEKFQGFKQKIIDDNEKKYGKEIRDKFGNDRVDNWYNKVEKMTEEEYTQVTDLANELMDNLREAFKSGEASCDLAQECAKLHKEWLNFYWDNYSKEAHAGLT